MLGTKNKKEQKKEKKEGVRELKESKTYIPSEQRLAKASLWSSEAKLFLSSGDWAALLAIITNRER